MSMPDGAQLSEDGKYWWDGSDWQPVPEDGGGSVEVGQLSEDGQWKWDGSQWQPAEDAEGGSGLHEALTSQGFDIAPEAADVDYVTQIHEHLNNWYQGLDANAQAIVDSLSADGADTLLADPEVGVVSADDPLVVAFAGTDKTLGESLEATGQALEQVQS
ncbi:hypothetical protein [Actinophytocola sp.]|uniref:hypothetical protein n=1 Tax=Actinophytocola sp. TaxID=1872138 RepID=UPI002ED216E7